MSPRDIADYLDDILQSISDIETFLGTISFEQFSEDRKNIHAVTRSLEIIGEAVKKIPTDLRVLYPTHRRDAECAEYFLPQTDSFARKLGGLRLIAVTSCKFASCTLKKLGS